MQKRPSSSPDVVMVIVAIISNGSDGRPQGLLCNNNIPGQPRGREHQEMYPDEEYEAAKAGLPLQNLRRLEWI